MQPDVAVPARCSLQGRPAPLPRPTRISFCREQGAPVCVSAARAARRLATNSVTSRRRTAPRVPLVSRLPARRGPPRSPLIRTARPLGGRAAEGLGQWHMSCASIPVWRRHAGHHDPGHSATSVRCGQSAAPRTGLIVDHRPTWTRHYGPHEDLPRRNRELVPISHPMPRSPRGTAHAGDHPLVASRCWN